jgi:hypothetical protein
VTKVPVDRDGGCPGHVGYGVQVDWVDAEPFNARLHVIGFKKLTSSTVIQLSTATGAVFEMLVKEFVHLTMKNDVVDGVIESTWIVKPRGGYYRIYQHRGES